MEAGQRKALFARPWVSISIPIILACLTWPAPPVHAAIAVDNASKHPTGDDAMSLTWSHTVGSGSGRILVVSVCIDDPGNSATSVEYDSIPLLPIGQSSGSETRVELYYLLAPPEGTADIVIVLSGSDGVNGGAVSFTGVSQSSPLGSFVSASATDDSSSVTAVSAAGEMVIDAVAVKGNRTFMVDPSQTSQWSNSSGDGSAAGSTEAGAASVTMSWTLSASSAWVIGAVPLKPAGPPLELVKTAFDLSGNAIPDDAIVPRGTLVKFLLYINNPGAPVSDVSLRDVLDSAFLYVGGSTTYDNSVASCAGAACTPAEEATIFAAADSGTAASDSVDADPVSFSGVILDIGNENAANLQLDIAGSKVWAAVFTVRMQ